MNGKSICSECFPSPLPPALKIASGLISKRLYALPRRPRKSQFPFPQEKKNLANFFTFSWLKELSKAKRSEKYASSSVPCTPCWMRFRRMNDCGANKISRVLWAREPKLFSHHRTAFCARLALLLLSKALSIIVHGMKTFFFFSSALCLSRIFTKNCFFSPPFHLNYDLLWLFLARFSGVYLRKWWPQSAMWMMTKQ